MSDQLGQEIVLRRYDWLCKKIARDYFAPGLDADDLHQEARIGLLRAAQTFKPEIGVPFEQFAGICIRRWMFWVLRREHRQSMKSLNDSVRACENEDGEIDAIVDQLPSYLPEPCELIVQRQLIFAVLKAVTRLTELERRALMGIVSGHTYAELEDLPSGSEPKSVDNAVQRARLKLRAEFEMAA